MDSLARMKEQSVSTVILPESDSVDESKWSTYLRELQTNYYN